MRLILRVSAVANKRPQREFASVPGGKMIDKQVTKTHETDRHTETVCRILSGK